MYLEKAKTKSFVSYRVMRYGGYSAEKKGALKVYVGSFRRGSKPDAALLEKLSEAEREWLETELARIEAELEAERAANNAWYNGYRCSTLPENLGDVAAQIEAAKFVPDDAWIKGVRDAIKRLQKSLRKFPTDIPLVSEQKPIQFPEENLQ